MDRKSKWRTGSSPVSKRKVCPCGCGVALPKERLVCSALWNVLPFDMKEAFRNAGTNIFRKRQAARNIIGAALQVKADRELIERNELWPKETK
jgi:hypothetical protein